MQDIYKDETYAAWVAERLELACLKLEDIAQTTDDYFGHLAGWILGALGKGRASSFMAGDWMQPELYSSAFDNPAAAAARFGSEKGRLLSWLSYEIRMIPALHMLKRDDEAAAVIELFNEIYGYYEQGELTGKALKAAAYWYVSDYCDIWLERYVSDCLTPSAGQLPELPLISEEDRWRAAQMDEMSEAAIEALAADKVEMFFKAHDAVGKKGSNVRLIADAGSERLQAAVRRRLEAGGFRAFACYEPLHSLCRTGQRTGYRLWDVSAQIQADHSEDLALFLDGALCDRILKGTEAAFIKAKPDAEAFAGAIDLTVAEKSLVRPVKKNEAARFDERQRKMLQKIYTAIDKAVNGIETT